MDIDGFKAINDTYGHDLGDSALRLLANVMRESFGREWLICRYGGDEFLVFGDFESSKALGDAVLAFENNLSLFNGSGEFPIPLSMSIGHEVADYGFTGDWVSFLKALDEKMYKKKKQYHAQLEEGQPIL